MLVKIRGEIERSNPKKFSYTKHILLFHLIEQNVEGFSNLRKLQIWDNSLIYVIPFYCLEKLTIG